ncbi:MAG TPA: Crp/Fnr family transcriptional regulator [Gammaproteobacteria bacterium]|nr:Crp/Fnr family transcriptional regulator [Gammaproteobacteria bacterium]
MKSSLARSEWPVAVTTARACEGCGLVQRCFLARPLPDDNGECRDIVRRRYPIARGERLYRRNTSFTSLYQVCNGSLKTQRETPEGDLVVTGFFLPGDVVGIDALADRQYQSDAYANVDTEVCQLDFERLLSHCGHKPGLNAWIISIIGSYVRRKDCDLSWSCSLQTHQRVLRFFLDLHDRLTQSSQAPSSRLALPMKKQDIASYLHMTPETLSRNLAQLRRQGLLQLHDNRFTLPDTSRARAITGL